MIVNLKIQNGLVHVFKDQTLRPSSTMGSLEDIGGLHHRANLQAVHLRSFLPKFPIIPM